MSCLTIPLLDLTSNVNAASSNVVCDVLIKFLASNSMHENAVDVFVQSLQTKDILYLVISYLSICQKEIQWTIFIFL